MTTKPQPFLTESQRAALDSALAAKAAEQAKARTLANHARAATGERKSRHAKGPGGPKKGGAGGKYTWGSLLTYTDNSTMDKHDPNYDSDEERTVVLKTHQSQVRAEVQEYKDQIRTIVEEYFDSADISEVADSLEECGPPDLAHYFVKRLLTLALDRKDREREMASLLLSSLYAEVIPAAQVRKGFTALIDSLDDLVLDVPDAPELLARFIARGVVDDVLPPAIVTRIPDAAGSACADLRHKVEALLGSRHSAEKVLRCWGGAGAGLSHQDTKDAVTALLAEYLGSYDIDEAARRLRGLACPFFHHELVKQSLLAAMEHDKQAGAVVALLARLAQTNEVSAFQFSKGLKRVSDQLDDLVLDNPAARERFAAVTAQARAAHLFEEPESPEAAGQDANGHIANGNGHATAPATANGTAHAPLGVAAYKRAVVAAVKEFFDSQDVTEAVSRLSALGEPGLHPLLVKAAVSLAMDRKDRERELVSGLLVALCAGVVSHDEMAAGFTRLLQATDDLVLDIPDAVHLLSLFLGRALVDELLPPSFLAQCLAQLSAEGLGVAVVKAAGSLLSARHGSERLSNCWHGGALTLDQIRDQIRTALQEYVTSGDVDEVARCMADLDVPAFHHELVLRAAELAFQRLHHADSAQADSAQAGPEAAAAPLATLLAALSARGVVNQTQMAKGFARVRARLEDEVLDYGPAVRDVYAWLQGEGLKGGWLVEDTPAGADEA